MTNTDRKELRSHRQADKSTKRRSRHGLLKSERKKIAARQVDRLLSLALVERKFDRELAEKQAGIAWKMATRFNVRLKEKRLLYCHYCKKFIPPPHDSRYRLSKNEKAIIVTCLHCGRTYRRRFGA